MGDVRKRRRTIEEDIENGTDKSDNSVWEGERILKPKTNRERNKLTRDALSRAFLGSEWKIAQALDKLFDKDPEAYINAVAKLANYVLPKYSSAEIIDNTPKKVELNVGDMSVEELKKMMNDIDGE